ncbi:MAG: tyrosine-type recombinase/integrase [Bryobacteraceae bacterium]|nr:tyrosine-type recombinase/integrase [Bryobacteraceae bacterium]
MATLTGQIREFLEERRRENVSPHTLRNYGIDLNQFAAHFPTPPERWTVLILRGWLAALHTQGLSPVSIRRKIAALRSFFQFLLKRGAVDFNPAKLLRTPKAPKTLPRVMSEEAANHLVDAVGGDEMERPFPERDRALFEILYGCGLRISELCGLDLLDLDLTENWLRVRGKGRKERQVPIGDSAVAALRRYLEKRHAESGERGVFVNYLGTRLTDRGARGIVSFYARMVAHDPSIHPHSFRHAYATHLLTDGADLRAIQELLGHAQLSTTQKYTQMALNDLLAVYDKAHPKA